MCKRRRVRECAAAAAGVPFALLAVPTLHAQAIPGLDKGHNIFLDRGLQIEAQSFTVGGWTTSRWAASNFTTINWQSDSPMPSYYAAPGVPWGKWTDTTNFASSYT